MTVQSVSPALSARLKARSGEFTGQTSGMAPGYVQGNLAIVPAEYAADFQRFCHLNPKPCPLLASSTAGDPRLPTLGADLDIRTDLPRYRVWRDGELVEEPTDVRSVWRDDLVAFVIGCSHSFEEALLQDGLRMHHMDAGGIVTMYRTNVETNPAGPFHGPMVVSMRSFTPADAIRAIQITSRFPSVHGAPVHIGHPHLIGIKDLTKPDWGVWYPMSADETPVFWACGVTPQSVIMESKLPFCITHAPGAMLVTDLLNSRLAVM